MNRNECILTLFLVAMALMFLLALQNSCIEYGAQNDAYRMERFKIEEGVQ